MRCQRTRLLPRVCDAEPLIRPRVQHARRRQEPVNELSHPFPRQPVPLTASSQTLEPFHADVIAECREQVSVRRYREVGKVAFDHGCEPPPLLVDRLMPVLSQRFLELPKLGLHPLSLCLAPELEVGAVLLGAAVVVNPKKSNVSGFPLPRSARRSAAYLPNSIRRVFSGCRLSANLAKRSLRSFRKRSASCRCWKPTIVSSAYRTTIISPVAWRLTHCWTQRS